MLDCEQVRFKILEQKVHAVLSNTQMPYPRYKPTRGAPAHCFAIAGHFVDVHSVLSVILLAGKYFTFYFTCSTPSLRQDQI